MTDETIQRGTFVARVNAEAEKAREAIRGLWDLRNELQGATPSDVVALLEIEDELHSVNTGLQHLENARLRILDFARQTDDA